MTGRARLAIDGDRRVRHAIEVRHDSFVNDEFRSLAKRHAVAIVVADTGGEWPMMLDAAADLCVRLRRRQDLNDPVCRIKAANGVEAFVD